MSFYVKMGLSLNNYLFCIFCFCFCGFCVGLEPPIGSGGSRMHLLCKSLLHSSYPAQLAVICQEYCGSCCTHWMQAEISADFTKFRKAERTVHAGLNGKQRKNISSMGYRVFFSTPFPVNHHYPKASLLIPFTPLLLD